MHLDIRQKRQTIALLLALLVILALLLTVAYSLMESEHQCTGEDCPVCLQIVLLHTLVRQLALLGLFVYALCSYHNLCRLARCYGGFPLILATPVTLYTRMNN